jgi:hypothetical protein
MVFSTFRGKKHSDQLALMLIGLSEFPNPSCALNENWTASLYNPFGSVPNGLSHCTAAIGICCACAGRRPDNFLHPKESRFLSI